MHMIAEKDESVAYKLQGSKEKYAAMNVHGGSSDLMRDKHMKLM